jgi:hypothetical protein
LLSKTGCVGFPKQAAQQPVLEEKEYEMLMPSHVKKFPQFILLTLLAASFAYGQELPRPSMARHEDNNSLPTTYNMKLGPVLFDVTGSIDSEFNDNIGLTNTGEKSDFLITPEVGIGIRWPVTESNTLSFNTSLGYTRYLIHPQFDSANILVAPNSELAFNLFVGDFKFTFHDNFAYEQDPVNEGAFSNVVTFDRFTNDAGITGVWDLNQVVLTLSYDHITFLSTGIQDSSGAQLSDPGALDYSADQVAASAEFHVTSTLSGGLEAAASTRSYNDFGGNYTQLSAGPFARVQISQYLRAQVSAGYQTLHSPNNSLNPGEILPANVYTPGSTAGTDTSWYADLTFDHQVNQYFIHHLSLGHELELGLLGDQSDVYYANYTASWKVNTFLNLAFTLGYQDVNEEGALVEVSNYNMFNAGVQASFPITKSITGAVIYQFNDKFAADDAQSYEQNEVGLNLTYQF